MNHEMNKQYCCMTCNIKGDFGNRNSENKKVFKNEVFETEN